MNEVNALPGKALLFIVLSVIIGAGAIKIIPYDLKGESEGELCPMS